jgi:hypothetical protein
MAHINTYSLKKARVTESFLLILFRQGEVAASARRPGPAAKLGEWRDEAMSDVQYDRFEGLTEEGESTIEEPGPREPGPRWSPRRSALFLAVSSVGLWALIALAVELFG